MEEIKEKTLRGIVDQLRKQGLDDTKVIEALCDMSEKGDIEVELKGDDNEEEEKKEHEGEDGKEAKDADMHGKDDEERKEVLKLAGLDED